MSKLWNCITALLGVLLLLSLQMTVVAQGPCSICELVRQLQQSPPPGVLQAVTFGDVPPAEVYYAADALGVDPARGWGVVTEAYRYYNFVSYAQQGATDSVIATQASSYPAVPQAQPRDYVPGYAAFSGAVLNPPTWGGIFVVPLPPGDWLLDFIQGQRPLQAVN